MYTTGAARPRLGWQACDLVGEGAARRAVPLAYACIGHLTPWAAECQRACVLVCAHATHQVGRVAGVSTC